MSPVNEREDDFGSKPINYVQPLDTFEFFAVVGDEGALVGHGGASDQVVERADGCAVFFECGSNPG